MISDPKKPTAIAKKYNILIQEYNHLQQKANDMIFAENTFDPDLVAKLTQTKEEMEKVNRSIYNSINFVFPEPENELTFH